MTDSYVEQLLINKFLEMASLETVSKCHQYYQKNKEAEETLPAFDYFKPEYPEEATEEEKEKIDGPKEFELFEWFGSVYPNIYKTEEGTEEDDELYEAIKAEVIVREIDKPIQKRLELYNEEGEKVFVPVYPVVFENLMEERDEVSEEYTNAWYEVYFNPSAPRQIELGTKGRSRWSGFLQINVCIPKNWGTETIRARYDEIAALFRSGLILEGARITRTYRGPNITESDFIWCPVSVDWQADLDR